MKYLRISVVLVISLFAATISQGSERGRVTGGVPYTLPDWFTESFLDLSFDVEHAARQGKHVLVFMHLTECPYCERMLNENFTSGESQQFIESHFDVIPISVRGHRDVTWIDGNTYSERELAKHVRAFGTPTLIFLDLDGNKILQFVGYRDPRALRDGLEFIQSRSYESQEYADFLARREKPVVYTLRKDPRFSRTTYFKDYAGPLAVLFEDPYCEECDRFHDTTLRHPHVDAEIRKFLFVRLDTESEQPIIDLDGNQTTPAKWAKELGLSYRPALVLFNEGKERYRADGRLYQHHFKEALHFVSERHYNQYDSMSAFKAAYRADLMNRGLDVDFSDSSAE